MDAHTDNVKTVYPPQTKFAGGINTIFFFNYNQTPLDMYNGLFQVYCIKPEGRIH